MLRKLQIQLTLFYFFASVILVGAVGAGLYYRLSSYFQSSTDLLLKYSLAQELRALTQPITPDLEAAEQEFLITVQPRIPTPAWTEISDEDEEGTLESVPPTLAPLFIPTQKKPSKPSDSNEEPENSADPEPEDESSDDSSKVPGTDVPSHGTVNPRSQVKVNAILVAQSTPEPANAENEAVFTGELASIFVIRIDRSGGIVSASNRPKSSLPDQLSALQNAKRDGIDIRSLKLQSGTPVRLLTYYLPENQDIAFLQLGRPVDDQMRLLNQFLVSWLGIGLICLIFTGVGSWWLAGKTLMPAQKSMEKQRDFVANASHELRTPLTLIRASTETALRSEPNMESQKLLNDVLSDVDDMSKLFDDLLLLSRLDDQKLALKLETVHIQTIFEDISIRVKRLGYTHDVRIVLDHENMHLLTDPERLKQILWIITDNALKHSPADSVITFKANYTPTTIQIKVVDEGAGIPKEHLPYIFERFYRAPAARGKQRRGAGLGLPIAKGLVQCLRGNIHIESASGKGTMVILSLPRA